MWQELDDLGPLVVSETVDVESASAAIRDLCGWHIAPVVEQTLLIDEPMGRADIFLPTLRLLEVTAVTVEGVALDVDQLAAVDWSSRGYLGRGNGGRWPTRRRSVEVTVRHGWPAPPASVARVCMALAQRMGASPAGLVRQQVGQRSEEYLRGLHASELADLAPYVIPVSA